MLKINTTKLIIAHVHSHNNMWINEAADSFMHSHQLAMEKLGIGPRIMKPIPLSVGGTKKLIKRLYLEDENLFWMGLAMDHHSISGHIRSVLGLNRKRIKLILIALSSDRRLQTIGSALITGLLFKMEDQGILSTPACYKCKNEWFTWKHFFKCFGLIEWPAQELKNMDKIATLIYELAKMIHPDMDIPAPEAVGPIDEEAEEGR